MKTKALFSLIIYLCCATCIYAQSNLYKETKQIQGEGYTYQCETDGVVVNLYNTSQQFVKMDQVNRKTGKHSGFKDTYTPHIAQDTWTRPKCYSTVRNAFSEEEKQRLKWQILDISLYIHPDTGKIIDVMFTFSTIDGFSTIPLSVYRNIELELKKNIWFTTTENGKKWNYVLLWWQQIVSK